jgi:hypothetical protein
MQSAAVRWSAGACRDPSSRSRSTSFASVAATTPPKKKSPPSSSVLRVSAQDCQPSRRCVVSAVQHQLTNCANH